jgi:CheY-like chemotaxis protein
MSHLKTLPAILLVEDDPDDITLTEHAITKSRLANPLRVVHDGEEALNYLSGRGPYADRQQNPIPFLVLLDLHMPKIDGFEVLRWIRAQPDLDQVRVAVLTSSKEERDLALAEQLGADSYFQKPGSLEELVSLMFRLKAHWILIDDQPAPAKAD